MSDSRAENRQSGVVGKRCPHCNADWTWFVWEDDDEPPCFCELKSWGVDRDGGSRHKDGSAPFARDNQPTGEPSDG